MDADITEKTRTDWLRLRLVLSETAMIGPGKAELLERIDATGSISAAGRDMNMSYKRAWTLVDTMNDAFARPLVDSVRGGPKGGGARLTDEGRLVLAAFRRLERRVLEAGSEEVALIRARLRDVSQGK